MTPEPWPRWRDVIICLAVASAVFWLVSFCRGDRNSAVGVVSMLLIVAGQVMAARKEMSTGEES